MKNHKKAVREARAFLFSNLISAHNSYLRILLKVTQGLFITPSPYPYFNSFATLHLRTCIIIYHMKSPSAAVILFPTKILKEVFDNWTLF